MPTPNRTFARTVRRSTPFVLPLLLLAVACGDDGAGPGSKGPPVASDYMASLPSWASFAAPDTVLHNELDAAGDTLPLQEVTLDSVPVYGTGPTGIDSVRTNVRYVCQARPYTVSEAPTEIVMFSPNRANLYPGAFIQGKSKKELGSLLPLSVAERTPIRVSIPELSVGSGSSNFREVSPTQATVDAGRSELIGDAVTSDLATPVVAHWEMTTYHSESSFALSAHLSGRYLGFSGKAGASVQQQLSETTVTAQYVERMYTVVVEPPVGGFFSDDFDQTALDRYVGQGLIGPDNLPVYISEVVYGRMMMFSVTSTASESEIRTAMQASYNTFTGGANLSTDTKSKAILERSKITIAAVGGSGDAVASMIQTGNWSAYFDSTPKLSEAVPLSYTFTNIGDGSIAAVTESTDYNVNECQPKPLIPGVFDFNPAQAFSVPLTPGYQTLFGDVNGDDREDMIFSYASGSTNELSVALANGSGGYAAPTARHDATVVPTEGSWSLYDQAIVGDFDNDGKADVAFNRLDSLNVLYVATSNGDGTFAWGERQERADGVDWGTYTPYVADLDNADGSDLLWNVHNGGTNRTYVALSAGDGTFDLGGAAQDQSGTCCWSGTDLMIGDVTGDGILDLVHSRTDANDNADWVAIGAGDGTFPTSAFTRYGGPGWADYKPLIGDIDNDTRSDLFWIADSRASIPIHRALGTPSGTLTKLSYQTVTPPDAAGTGPFEVRVGDVDGDGDSDIILVDMVGTNNKVDGQATSQANRVKIWVGLGTVDASLFSGQPFFEFTPVDQLLPDSDTWSQYKVRVGDVNGDSKSDVVLYRSGAPYQVYVALSK
jgi:hypothetical protein